MKHGLVAALLVSAGLAISAPVAAVQISGILTTADFLASDDIDPEDGTSDGHFYYDLYRVTNIASPSAKLDVTVSYAAGANLTPFMAYTFSPVLPASTWTNAIYDALETAGNPAAGSTVMFNGIQLGIGASFLLAVGNLDYIEDGGQLDTYELTITGVVHQSGCEAEAQTCPGVAAATFTDATLSVEQILPNAAPEPFTSLLLGIGLAGLAFTRRRATA